MVSKLFRATSCGFVCPTPPTTHPQGRHARRARPLAPRPRCAPGRWSQETHCAYVAPASPRQSPVQSCRRPREQTPISPQQSLRWPLGPSGFCIRVPLPVALGCNPLADSRGLPNHVDYKAMRDLYNHIYIYIKMYILFIYTHKGRSRIVSFAWTGDKMFLEKAKRPIYKTYSQ